MRIWAEISKCVAIAIRNLENRLNTNALPLTPMLEMSTAHSTARLETGWKELPAQLLRTSVLQISTTVFIYVV